MTTNNNDGGLMDFFNFYFGYDEYNTMMTLLSVLHVKRLSKHSLFGKYFTMDLVIKCREHLFPPPKGKKLRTPPPKYEHTHSHLTKHVEMGQMMLWRTPIPILPVDAGYLLYIKDRNDAGLTTSWMGVTLIESKTMQPVFTPGTRNLEYVLVSKDQDLVTNLL